MPLTVNKSDLFYVIKVTIFSVHYNRLGRKPLISQRHFSPNILFAWLTTAPSVGRDYDGRKVLIMKSSHSDSAVWFMSTGPKKGTPAFSKQPCLARDNYFDRDPLSLVCTKHGKHG